MTFPPSASDAIQTITVTLIDDNIHEPVEGFFLQITVDESSGGPLDDNGANSIALINIFDNDCKHMCS